MEDDLRGDLRLFDDSPVRDIVGLSRGDVHAGEEGPPQDGPHGHLLPDSWNLHAFLPRDASPGPSRARVDHLRHRVGRDACGDFFQDMDDGTVQGRVYACVHRDGVGGDSRDRPAHTLAPRAWHDVAYAWRRALHAWLRLLSLEVASLRSHGVAPVRARRHDLPLLLHTLVCDVGFTGVVSP